VKQESLFDEATAEEAKDVLLDAVAAKLTPEKVEAMREIQYQILQMAQTGRAFTADDVVARLPNLNYPNLVGIGFHQAAKKRIIRPVGVTVAKRKERHGALVRVWKRAEEEVP
jgi:hypothetical protein